MTIIPYVVFVAVATRLAVDCVRVDYEGCDVANTNLNKFFKYSLLNDYGDGRKRHLVEFEIPPNSVDAAVPTRNWAVLLQFEAPGQYILSSWSLRPSTISGQPIQWFDDPITGYAHFYSNTRLWFVGQRVRIRFNTNTRSGSSALPLAERSFKFYGNTLQTLLLQNDPAPATQAEVDAECVKFDGGFVPSTDCTKYYRCDHGVSHLMSCPPGGLEWNPNKHTCDWKNNAGCSQPASKTVLCDYNGVDNCSVNRYEYTGQLCPSSLHSTEE